MDPIAAAQQALSAAIAARDAELGARIAALESAVASTLADVKRLRAHAQLVHDRLKPTVERLRAKLIELGVDPDRVLLDLGEDAGDPGAGEAGGAGDLTD